MKNLTWLVWLTQLGLSIALPVGGFIYLAVWLRERFHWGAWVVCAGAIIGIFCAVDWLRVSLQAMLRLARKDKEPEAPAAFNDHD